jgi:hypothetical protein
MHKRTRPAQRKFPDKNRRRWHVAWARALPGWIMHRSSATLWHTHTHHSQEQVARASLHPAAPRFDGRSRR